MAIENAGDAALPDYAQQLAAFHRAFANELAGALDLLPIRPGMRVLDVACGDGAYTGWIAERLRGVGQVVGVDLLPAYLELARANNVRHSTAQFVTAALEKLPFDDDYFDVVWCAQSFYSLDDPITALGRMRRVLRPGGMLAVLENDTLHQLLLPWPGHLELAIRVAELAVFCDETTKPRKYYVGRRLREVFAAAGLCDVSTKTLAIDRHAPFSPDEIVFLSAYLGELAEHVRPHLTTADREAFDKLLDPTSADYLITRPLATITWLNTIAWGFEPGE